ncbi:flavin reductase family protein [Kitasatospora herbaricolor]|uniref:Flavin reductase family protein n=1 Tax=Kitasatospora herbaricolor TaxID=68217 RepID=A0ABZ1WCY1_9ACTN|nr:flavin reductase family protein [Kitasatospora herbaricolor]
MAVDSGSFRELFGSFPTAVSIVTALGPDGEPRGFTCNAMSAVSADPPLLLVCVDLRSQTLEAMSTSKSFVVNVLADGGQDAALVFASRSDGKFAEVDWQPSKVAGGAPVLRSLALAYAECNVVQMVEAGDHVVFFARVDGVEVLRRPPMLYHRGAFSAWEGSGAFAAPAR